MRRRCVHDRERVRAGRDAAWGEEGPVVRDCGAPCPVECPVALAVELEGVVGHVGEGTKEDGDRVELWDR